jgi:cytoplasmic iron level regulating protein YaaA (DUF328/UPF0246 family)
LIISGLYGIIDFRDSILDYHLEISRKPLWSNENNLNILETVKQYLVTNDISNDMVFYSLSDVYKNALKPIPQWINLWIKVDRGDSSARFLDQQFLSRL